MTNQPGGRELEALLEFVRDTRGFDFTGYKRTSLGRRIRKRMNDVGAASFADYRDRLETHADEFTELFNTVLINVTGFFRDAEAWEYLRNDVIPGLVEGNAEIRIWSAGCSTGEEAYSLAILFAEALGLEAFTERVKIYATDLDDDALGTARKGVYTHQALEAVPAELRAKYFEASGTRMAFRPELRRRVIFGRLDLIADAPISRLDLLCCRNTLMYFNAETQTQILSRLHFALRDSGAIFLGKAEMLMSNGARFAPVSMPYRIFRCRPGSHDSVDPLAPVDVARTLSSEALRHRRLRELTMDGDPSARVLIDRDGIAVEVNKQARSLFGLTPRDEGRPLRDLELSYRPVELRSLIEQAQTERRAVRLNAVERPISPTENQYLDVYVVPLVDSDNVILGVAVTFTDTTAFVKLQSEVKTSREELETAYEELQSTNEELETTNEELQSSNEELETTNEELQSTNEELETTNEELQSTNEELETMNDELRVRSAELDESNAFLSGVLGSVSAGVIVLDADLRVRSWNRASQELWGLRPEETLGEQFFGLDLGLPTGPLRKPVRLCLDGATDERVDLQAVNRRGKQITCAVTCTPLSGAVSGVVVLIEPGQQ
ncbi:MAG TPA: CheR family methyltransferase [Mycobacteriales bacterium]|jgi:two-component system CheB/CheR fusion protein|nr:CheR family methyltransferase [Mycobacteriales bacterium]